MKCPKTPDEVELNRNPRGVYERTIGKSSGGWKRWRFNTDETTAKMEAWNVWKRWEQRPKGVETWEDLEKSERYKLLGKQQSEAFQKMKAQADEISAKLVAQREAAERAKWEKPKASFDLTIAEAQTLYLAAQQKRIGLLGSLGLARDTYTSNAYRLLRAMEFIPPLITHLRQLDYPALETVIYAIAARPKRKPSPLAKEKTKKEQRKRPISQASALNMIKTFKTFLSWCVEDDRVGYSLPRHAKKLFGIRPEAEEQQIRTIDQDELKILWTNSVNQQARKGDKGKRRRLYLMLGLNCGFYAVDICTLAPGHIKKEGNNTYIWKLRRKTRKTNAKLARTKWLLWPETVQLLAEYMPFTLTPNQIRLAWRRLTPISHSHLRDTGAVFMEKVGGRELADTYLAHSRGGVIDSYSHPDWDHLSNALQRLYNEFVKPAIG